MIEKYIIKSDHAADLAAHKNEIERLEEELSAVTEQRDRLAKALDQIADLGKMVCMAWEPQSFRATEIAINALATLNQPEP